MQIDAVDATQLPGLTGFALHLRRDLDAVTAASPWIGARAASQAP
ncbi:hypothetical protein ACIQUZ_34140 [Streptomyces griseus]